MYDHPVKGQSQNAARVLYIRNIRIVAGAVALAAILGAGVLLYMFGLKVHPHRVAFGAVIAGIYIVVFGGAYSFVYRSQMAAARRM
jgi:cytochrome c biogenesis protein CcdA